MGSVRRVLAESLALGAAGGVLGLVAGATGVRGLLALMPADLPRMENVALDWTVLGFALAVAAGVGLLFGLPSALQAAMVPPAATLREGGRGFAGAAVRLAPSGRRCDK